MEEKNYPYDHHYDDDLNGKEEKKYKYENLDDLKKEKGFGFLTGLIIGFILGNLINF